MSVCFCFVLCFVSVFCIPVCLCMDACLSIYFYVCYCISKTIVPVVRLYQPELYWSVYYESYFYAPHMWSVKIRFIINRLNLLEPHMWVVLSLWRYRLFGTNYLPQFLKQSPRFPPLTQDTSRRHHTWPWSVSSPVMSLDVGCVWPTRGRVSSDGSTASPVTDVLSLQTPSRGTAFQFNWDRLTLAVNSLSDCLRLFCSVVRLRHIMTSIKLHFAKSYLTNLLTYLHLHL